MNTLSHPNLQGLYCDGDIDCEDGSDEPPGCSARTLAPPSSAPPAAAEPGREGAALCAGEANALYCAGRCVPAALVCDGRDHCVDGGGGGAGSDEDPVMCCK